jgi:hypothetical protein
VPNSPSEDERGDCQNDTVYEVQGRASQGRYHGIEENRLTRRGTSHQEHIKPGQRARNDDAPQESDDPPQGEYANVHYRLDVHKWPSNFDFERPGYNRIRATLAITTAPSVGQGATTTL